MAMTGTGASPFMLLGHSIKQSDVKLSQ